MGTPAEVSIPNCEPSWESASGLQGALATWLGENGSVEDSSKIL